MRVQPPDGSQPRIGHDARFNGATLIGCKPMLAVLLIERFQYRRFGFDVEAAFVLKSEAKTKLLARRPGPLVRMVAFTGK